MADSQPDYRVRWDAAMPDIRSLRDRVLQIETSEPARLALALRELDRELRRNPLEWGEPKFVLKKIGWIVCIGFSHRYRVIYAVDEPQRQVYIRGLYDHDD